MLNAKQWTLILLALIFIREAQNGYFRPMPAYLRSVPWKKQALYFLAGLAFLTPLFFLDLPLLGAFQARTEALSGLAASLGRHLGRRLWVYLGSAYVLAWLCGQNKLRREAASAILGAAAAGMACNTLKMIFLRARPDTGVGPFVFFHWSALASDTRPYESFPSGDVAIVAGAAAVFFFKTRAPWRWLWLILPLCTAYSRVLLNRHWPADTLASLGLGLWVAFCLSGYAPDPRPASRGAETMRCS